MKGLSNLGDEAMKATELLKILNESIERMMKGKSDCEGGVLEFMLKNKPRRISVELLPKFKIDEVKK